MDVTMPVPPVALSVWAAATPLSPTVEVAIAAAASSAAANLRSRWHPSGTLTGAERISISFTA